MPMASSLNAVELRELRGVKGGRSPPPPPWTGSGSGPVLVKRGFENASYQQDEEQIEQLEKQQGAAASAIRPPSASNCSKHRDYSPESYNDEEGDAGASRAPGEGQGLPVYSPADQTPTDLGFVLALVFLVSGIVLVVIAYTIPREARVDPDSVSARQMERLESYYARLGSHLDKCIIAGLGLLTLGGMFLSVLLMVSICRGDMYQRRPAFVRPKRTYGSINLRMKQLATGEAGGGAEEFLVEHAETQDDTQTGSNRDFKSEPGPVGAVSAGVSACGV